MKNIALSNGHSLDITKNSNSRGGYTVTFLEDGRKLNTEEYANIEAINEDYNLNLKEADFMMNGTIDRGELVRAAMAKATEEKAQGYRIEENKQYKSKEIYFTGIPAKETRENLKALKFRWHNVKKCWYGFATDEDIKKACGDVLVIPDGKTVDPGSLYEGWEGGKARTWHSDQELKKFILDDCKKVGIKASIRFKKAGYLTSFLMTVTLKPEHIKTYEDFKKDYDPFRHVSSWHWLSYTDETGKIKDILFDQVFSMPEGKEKAELLENITRTAYDGAIKRLGTSNRYDYSNSVLTDEGAEILKTAHAIVSSYNRDCTNSMIDYFDRDIYDDYAIKVA